MKRLFLFIFWVMFLMFPISAMCAPFLTCDCTPASDKITGFQLQFGTQPPIDIPAVECLPVVVEGKRILYDLGTMPNGAFTVKALAKNLWGVSEWTNPLSDTKTVPSSPSLLKIIP
jgi:hypothetical protein